MMRARVALRKRSRRLGVALWVLNVVALAGACADESSTTPPASSERALTELARERLSAAESLLGQGRYERVDEVLAPLLNARPPVPLALLLSGWAAYQGTDYGRCASRMGAAVEADPLLWPHARTLAFAHYKLGDYALARESFERILQVPPSAESFARVYQDTSKLDVESSIQRERCRLHYGLGQVSLTVGELDVARRELARALELDPGYLKARNAWAELLAEEGRSEQALAAVDLLLSAWPAHSDALHLRAELLSQLDREAEAELALERWREVFDARAEIGQLNSLVKEGQDDPKIWQLIADAFEKLGDAGEARRALESGVARHPADAELRTRLEALRRER